MVFNFKTDEARKKQNEREIFLMTPEKVRNAKLHHFLAKYNYYINKLLITKSDPFIEKQNRIYLRALDFKKLSKL